MIGKSITFPICTEQHIPMVTANTWSFSCSLDSLKSSSCSCSSKDPHPHKVMGIRLPGLIHAKQILRRSLSQGNQLAAAVTDVPKGHLAVYVGETQKKRFVVPVSYLNQPLFQDLLSQAEEEFGFDHPMGGLTIPCKEDIFIDLTSRLNGLCMRK
ncbi:auxin-responsive protein SAUR23-like [Macadamia integrifolia]|uniref:auxin-responsive protein SAUR23-like n=1 Tax=Macadamia integrifolia TaxID=60698 RepID=UPI001C4F7A48|nr:auxin-responsive protein SAUR23-like [Macadamia integrifolia]